jgi:hypothetical protein
VYEEGPLSFAMYWCSDFNLSSWDSDPSHLSSTTSVVVWLNVTGPSLETTLGYPSDNAPSQAHAEGFINCTYSFDAGFATLVSSGPFSVVDSSVSGFYYDGTFSGVTSDHDMNLAAYGDHFWPPVYAKYASLAQDHTLDHLTIPRSFFTEPLYGGPNYISGYSFSGSIDRMANIIATGVSRMHAAAGIATLGTPPITRTLPIRYRNTRVFVAAVPLLAAWLIFLFLCFRRLFSRAFGSSLNAYVAARLLVGTLRFISFELAPLTYVSSLVQATPIWLKGSRQAIRATTPTTAHFAPLHPPPESHDGLHLRTGLADMLTRLRRRREQRSTTRQARSGEGRDFGGDVALKTFEESVTKGGDLECGFDSASPSLKHPPSP